MPKKHDTKKKKERRRERSKQRKKEYFTGDEMAQRQLTAERQPW